MKLSTEKRYKEAMSTYIAERWSKKEEGFLCSFDEKKLAWMSLTGFNTDKVIVFLSGRRGSYLKYKELFWELTENGYDVFCYDRRGQGASERITGDPELGHIEDFNDYVEDLEYFMEKIVLPRQYKQQYLVSHSMGGVIATLYLVKHPDVFSSTVLLSPMFGIYLSPLTRSMALCLSKFLAKRAPRPDYVITQGPYRVEPFVGNPLTSCRLRYHCFDELCASLPKIKMGGPSPWWIYESLSAGSEAIARAEQIEIPLLLLRGSRDKVVDNSSQDLFIEKIKEMNASVFLTEIKGAKHELLSESDEYRIPTMTLMLEFLQKHA